MDLNVGLIGASSFGRHHLKAFQESPYVRSLSLAGRNLEKLSALRAEFNKVNHVTADYHELMRLPEIQLIDIVLPHDLHRPVALEALEAGKHVICEKPPARSLPEADEMVRASRRTGKRLFIVMNQIFNPAHRKIREALDSGAIGMPFLAFEYGLNNNMSQMTDLSNWRGDRDRCGGGPMIDGGYHQVYRHLYFFENFGRPAWVSGVSGQIGIDVAQKGEDFVALTVGYDTGLHVHLVRAFTVRYSPPHGPGCIVGDEGTLVLEGPEDRPFRLLAAGGEKPVDVLGGPRTYEATIPPCIHYYLECLVQGREPRPGLEMALRTLEIIEAATVSGRTGQRVHLRPRAAAPGG